MSIEAVNGNAPSVSAVFNLAGKQVGVVINPNETYTTDQLAIEFGIPEYAFRERVRDGRLNGKKLGKFYFVTGEEVIRFLNSDFSYSPRPTTRKNEIAEDINKSAEKEKGRAAKQRKS